MSTILKAIIGPLFAALAGAAPVAAVGASPTTSIASFVLTLVVGFAATYLTPNARASTVDILSQALATLKGANDGK